MPQVIDKFIFHNNSKLSMKKQHFLNKSPVALIFLLAENRFGKFSEFAYIFNEIVCKLCVSNKKNV